jgi:hypothetical protein
VGAGIVFTENGRAVERRPGAIASGVFGSRHGTPPRLRAAIAAATSHSRNHHLSIEPAAISQSV